MSQSLRKLSLLMVVVLLISQTDGCGRSRRCPPRDRTPPTLTCPANILTYNKPLQNHQYVTWEEPTAYDNGRRIVPTRVGPRPGQLFSGVTTIRYSAKDNSGNVATCSFTVTVRVITCPALSSQSNGYKWCHPSWQMRYGGSCLFGCYAGFTLIGATRARCLESGQWDNTQPVCQRKTCSILTPPANVRDITCTDSNYYRSICSYNCIEGYGIEQNTSKVRVCNAQGLWNGLEPACVDITPPVFTNCPHVVTGYTEATKTSGRVAWDTPTATDNAGYVTVTRTSGPSPAQELDAGEHDVIYTATDTRGNTATCSFKVVIKQIRCPTIYPLPYTSVTCPDGHIYGSSCEFSCDDGKTLNGTSNIQCAKVTSNSISYGKWNFGTVQPYCYSSVSCPDLIPPDNGAVACDTWLSGIFCRMFCQEGYLTRDRQMHSRHHTCSNGDWLYGGELPDCEKIVPGSREHQVYYINLDYHYYNGTCTEDHIEIRQSFLQIFPPDVGSGCQATSACTVEYVKVICGDVTGNVTSGRKRRETVAITFEVQMSMTDMSIPEILNFRSAIIDTLTSSTYGFTILDTDFTNPDVDVSLPTRLCVDGSIYDKQTGYCVLCSPGSYHDVASENCIKCAKGSFQPMSGSVTCEPCPDGQTTRTVGAVNYTACLDACTPGSYSRYGIVPCSLCDVGTYTDVAAATGCVVCPDSTTTLVPGASSFANCTDLDIQYVDNNTESDYFVPALMSVNTTGVNSSLVLWFYYNPQICTSILNVTQKDEVLLQLSYNDSFVVSAAGTSFTGSMTVQPNTWHYIYVRMQDSKLDMIVDESPVFSEIVATYSGHWVPDTVNITLGGPDCLGSFSQFNINRTNGSSHTSRTSCSNSQTGDLLSWKQFLEEGEDGTFIKVHSQCDVINNCDSEPCQNGGKCTDLYLTYTCTCPVGYSGYSCEINIDDCQNHACDNNATCVDGNNTYSCRCPSRFNGTLCEIKVVDGYWADWSEWSSCSVTCGEGTRRRERVCSDPAPDNGGQECMGNNTEAGVCQDRPTTDVDCVNECSVEPKINNGTMTCTKDTDGETIICVPACPDGWDFDSDFMVVNATKIQCGKNSSYRWNVRNDENPNMKLPSCQKTEKANQVNMLFGARYTELDKESIDDNGVKIIDGIMAAIAGHPCIDSGQCVIRTQIDVVTTQARKRRSTTGISFTTTVTCAPYETVDECYHHLANISEMLNVSISTQSLTVTYNNVNYDVDENSVTIDGFATCDLGTVPVFYYCIPCGEGMYQSGEFCYQCPIGFYQDKVRQGICKQCPDGWITPGVQSSSITDCSVIIVVQADDETETIPMMILLIVGGLVVIIITVAVLIFLRKKKCVSNRPVTPNEPPSYEMAITEGAATGPIAYDNNIDDDDDDDDTQYVSDRNAHTQFSLEALNNVYENNFDQDCRQSVTSSEGLDDARYRPRVRLAW